MAMIIRVFFFFFFFFFFFLLLLLLLVYSDQGCIDLRRNGESL